MLEVPQDPDLETELVLVDLARRRFGRIEPQRIARHIMDVADGGTWLVRKAALDALARRYGFAERDGLKVAKRPLKHVLGVYRTRGTSSGNRAGGDRPYVTELVSLEPLRTQCSCADYLRSSLGLCKHGLVVLESVVTKSASRRRKLEPLPSPKKSTLSWDPRHPLEGVPDRLLRLTYHHAGRAKPLVGFRDGRPLARLLRDAGPRLSFLREIEKALKRGSVLASPSVVVLLEEERARAERQSEARAASKQAMKCLGTLRRKLYPYQRESVARFFELGRLLLADDMGLGKTTQAIASCHGLFESGRIRRGILIVPAALKFQWKREWEATTHVPIRLVDGSPAERAQLYASTKAGFLCMGYEQLLRDLPHVQRFSPDMVVLDEAQRIKNWATKSAAYVKALSPAYRLVLTGTPMENRLDELASIMDFVDELALEPKWRLVPFHTLEQGDGGKGRSGVQHLDVLRGRLAKSMMRRVRQDVLSQLPSRTDTRVPVEITEAQREQHDDLRRPIAELMRKAATRALRQAEFLQLMQLLTRQRMICNGLGQVHFEAEWPHLQAKSPRPEVLESLFMPKLSVLRGLIEQVVIGQQRKVVIFSQWRSMLRLSEWAVRDLLQAAGMRAVFFTGAESAKVRENAIIDLHDDPRTTVMFLSDAGGVGLNLQRAASCCINLELPWNPAVLEQRIGRIYRLGQTLPIDVYNLVTEEGIESRIAILVAQKKAVFSSLFDGTTDQVVFDGDASFMAGVKKLVDPVEVPVLIATDDNDEDVIGSALAAEQTVDTAEIEAKGTLASEVTAPPPVASGVPGLSIGRLADGGLRIDAPPELAGPLADLLETLARSLRAPVPPV